MMHVSKSNSIVTLIPFHKIQVIYITEYNTFIIQPNMSFIMI